MDWNVRYKEAYNSFNINIVECKFYLYKPILFKHSVLI